MNALAEHSAKTLERSHFITGFLALLLASLLGIGLELAHAFKMAALLDADQETRRLLLRLAHAHGTLLGFLELFLGLCLGRLSQETLSRSVVGYLRAAALSALVLLPLGFLLGAWGAHEGDPGPGIWLSPVGALCLILELGLCLYLWISEKTERNQA